MGFVGGIEEYSIEMSDGDREMVLGNEGECSEC